VRLALEAIAIRCTDARLRLSDISDVVALSPSYLDRLLKRDTDLGFVDHVRRARVALAEQRLVTGEESVKAIALSVGFLHVSSFDRTFARVHGCTPTHWRELHTAVPERALSSR
jgi:two-component system response regulator YesN